MRKKVLTVLLSVLLLSMHSVFAEGSAEAGEGAVAKDSVKIAVALSDSGASIFTLMGNNVRRFLELNNSKVIFERTGFNTDRQIAFVENQIAAGVDGIVIAPAADSVANIINNMCNEAGVYWSIPFRTIKNEEIKTLLEGSQYYVGNCFENEEQSAYDVMQELNRMDIKNIAIISQAVGDTTADARERGVKKACEELGMEVVAEARALTQTTDVFSATESFISSHKDLDCVFILASTAAGSLEAVGKAIRQTGNKRVKIACIDFQDGMVDLFNENLLVCASGLPHWGIDPFMATVKVTNAAMGYPISDTSFSTSMNMLILTNGDMAQKYDNAFKDVETMFFSDEDMVNTLMKKNNSSMDKTVFQEIVNSYNPLKD